MAGATNRPWGSVWAVAVVSIVVIALGSGSGYTDWGVGAHGGGTPRAAVPAGGEETTVSQVVDADTIVVADGRTVRFIGVETPALGDCYGPEASARTNDLLPANTAVTLVLDEQRTDAQGRTLAYVYRARDGLFVNLALARDGFARDAIEPPNLTRVVEIVTAVGEAEARRRGLWGACENTTTTARPGPPRQ